ncbi:MAG: shikimate dehydrogenase [Opitutae bacterium]|nr:shikimate dehydrogenase [Opitutae bacterium]MBT5380464.1 shikimate dehydrogenase [Opitutae bacterium]MBT6462863.1 shikimate dehydrogenase [Opitutae bacterium]MBT7853046.1 shikimate dehydrogenase [Opitutae bacterium]
MNSNESTGSIPPWNKVYQLEELESWNFTGPSLAVLGHPIAHSLSPVIHNAALKRMGDRFSNWRYYAFDVPVERLDEGLSLFHDKGFLGLNLTIPHKVEVLDLIPDVDPVARRMGAVNTLMLGQDGYLGRNTDGFGIQNALKKELGVDLSGADVIILGAGGASRATVVQCLDAGCRKVWIGNRSMDRLQELVAAVGGANSRLATFSLTTPPDELPESALLINATSLGLQLEDPAPADLSAFPSDIKVYDMIYNPPETALLSEAHKLGLSMANGLSMLVYQAAQSLHYWTDAEIPVESMFEALANR